MISFQLPFSLELYDFLKNDILLNSDYFTKFLIHVSKRKREIGQILSEFINEVFEGNTKLELFTNLDANPNIVNEILRKTETINKLILDKNLDDVSLLEYVTYIFPIFKSYLQNQIETEIVEDEDIIFILYTFLAGMIKFGAIPSYNPGIQITLKPLNFTIMRKYMNTLYSFSIKSSRV